MMRSRRTAMKIFTAAAFIAFASMAVMADGVPTTVTYVPHDKAASTFAKGGQIIGDKGLVVMANRREAEGVASGCPARDRFGTTGSGLRPANPPGHDDGPQAAARIRDGRS